jgi:hypothetical protein
MLRRVCAYRKTSVFKFLDNRLKITSYQVRCRAVAAKFLLTTVYRINSKLSNKCYLQLENAREKMGVNN